MLGHFVLFLGCFSNFHTYAANSVLNCRHKLGHQTGLTVSLPTYVRRACAMAVYSNIPSLQLGLDELSNIWVSTTLREEVGDELLGIQHKPTITKIGHLDALALKSNKKNKRKTPVESSNNDEYDNSNSVDEKYNKLDYDNIKKNLLVFLKKNRNKIQSLDNIADIFIAYIDKHMTEINALNYARKDIDLVSGNVTKHKYKYEKHLSPDQFVLQYYDKEIKMNLLSHESLRKQDPDLLRALKNQAYNKTNRADISRIVVNKPQHISIRMLYMTDIFGISRIDKNFRQQIKSAVSIVRSISNSEPHTNLQLQHETDGNIFTT